MHYLSSLFSPFLFLFLLFSLFFFPPSHFWFFVCVFPSLSPPLLFVFRFRIFFCSVLLVGSITAGGDGGDGGDDDNSNESNSNNINNSNDDTTTELLSTTLLHYYKILVVVMFCEDGNKNRTK